MKAFFVTFKSTEEKRRRGKRRTELSEQRNGKMSEWSLIKICT